MSRPSTPCDMLRELYGSSEGAMPDRRGVRQGEVDKDISAYDPMCAQPLLDAGMAHRLNIPGRKDAYCLTDKGNAAAEMLLDNRTYGRFSMPDWLMNEIARPKNP